MTANQYMGKMKGFTTELVAGGCTIDDDELVDLILNDIDKDYNKLVSMVNALKNRTVSDLHDLICAFDMRQNMLSSGDKKSLIPRKTLQPMVMEGVMDIARRTTTMVALAAVKNIEGMAVVVIAPHTSTKRTYGQGLKLLSAAEMCYINGVYQ
jgi:hypothetical protein